MILVLFLVVNKAESDDIIRFCELNDVLPLPLLPVPYPLSAYLWHFPFAQIRIGLKWSKWNASRQKKTTKIKEKKNEKTERKECTEFLIIQCKRKNDVLYSKCIA